MLPFSISLWQHRAWLVLEDHLQCRDSLMDAKLLPACPVVHPVDRLEVHPPVVDFVMAFVQSEPGRSQFPFHPVPVVEPAAESSLVEHRLEWVLGRKPEEVGTKAMSI